MGHGEDVQDGGGVRRGDHLPPSKIHLHVEQLLLNIYRMLAEDLRLPKCKIIPTYLGRAKEKRKNRDKRIGTGPAPLGGSSEGGKLSTH